MGISGITVSLGASHTVTVTPAIVATLSAVTIMKIVDLQGQQIVRAFIKELNNPIVLWSSTSTPTYDSMGDWTQSQAETRIAQLINAM